MLPGRDSVKGKRLSIRHYRRYSVIAIRTRETIQRELGKPGGMMRKLASRHDPSVVLAFVEGEPVAWGALFRPGAIRWRKDQKRTPAVQIFVARKYRRCGIGKRIMERLLTRAGLWDGRDITYWPDSRAATRFYKSVGIGA